MVIITLSTIHSDFVLSLCLGITQHITDDLGRQDSLWIVFHGSRVICWCSGPIYELRSDAGVILPQPYSEMLKKRHLRFLWKFFWSRGPSRSQETLSKYKEYSSDTRVLAWGASLSSRRIIYPLSCFCALGNVITITYEATPQSYTSRLFLSLRLNLD